MNFHMMRRALGALCAFKALMRPSRWRNSSASSESMLLVLRGTLSKSRHRHTDR
jgi:hypothetical protein